MSTLKQRLDEIRSSFESKAPAEALALMHRSTENLRASGIMNGLPNPGTELPAFGLQDTDGQVVRSEDLLAKGPLIATFYRGLW